jgi:hypothetical protein
LNLFFDSGKNFVSHSKTANILLLDYFIYIGGLVGLWFGICLENMMDLLTAKKLRHYLKV